MESDAELERVLAALVVRAQKSRADAGNLEYVFSRCLENTNDIRLTEVWESESHLMSHLQIPDPEFDQVLATAKITSAIVKAYDGTNERVLITR